MEVEAQALEISVLTTLAPGSLLLDFVFVRESVHKRRADREAFGKLARIVTGFRGLLGRSRS